MAGGDGGRRAARDVFAGRRRFLEAALLAEQLGDREQAADYYLSSHRDLDAARLYADLGRDREAGRLYERVIEQAASPDDVGEAHLRLGLLLARRLQHEPRWPAQEAARRPDSRSARAARWWSVAALGCALRPRVSGPRRRRSTLRPRQDSCAPRAGAPAGPAAANRPTWCPDATDSIACSASGATGGLSRRDESAAASSRSRSVQRLRRGVRLRAVPRERRWPARSPPNWSGARLLGRLRYCHEHMVGTRSIAASSGDGTGAVRRLAAEGWPAGAAHRRGVSPRIKPPTSSSRAAPPTGDFGVLPFSPGPDPAGGLSGTLAYMSQCSHRRAVTIAADLMRFGVPVRMSDGLRRSRPDSWRSIW